MKRKIILCMIIICALLFITACSKKHNLNETVTISSSNIKLTVLGSEKETINEDDMTQALSLANGNYIKVKVTIENIGNETYTWSSINFDLGDTAAVWNNNTRNDSIQFEIPSGSSATGYIYFEDTNSDTLTYHSNVYADGSEAKRENVLFKIK